MQFKNLYTNLFQQPLLQSTVSHDPSEIILICWWSSVTINYYWCSVINNVF